MGSTSQAHTIDELGENVILPQLWHRMNLTDRIYAGIYVALGVAIFFNPERVVNWSRYLLLHLMVVEAISLLAWFRNRNRWFRFAHDWYPIFLFILIFEEIARLSLAFVTSWQDPVILRIEQSLFSIPPSVWLARFKSIFFVELMEFGYFTFYWLLPVVGGLLYSGIWRAVTLESADDPRQPFRQWMDALALGYLVCYTFFLFFPTESPARTLASLHGTQAAGGPFRWLVHIIQTNGGVHGNAFPSGHIMASFVSLLAAWKWKPRLGRWLTVPVLLMCAGAVYDSYHYVLDVIAGALIGAAAFWFIARMRRPDSASVA